MVVTIYTMTGGLYTVHSAVTGTEEQENNGNLCPKVYYPFSCGLYFMLKNSCR